MSSWAPSALRASEEARRRGDRRVGTEHVLLSLLEESPIQTALGTNLEQARQALQALDDQALGSLGMVSDAHVPPLPMRELPKKPTFRAVMQRDRLRLTPTAKKVLERAVQSNRRRTLVSAQQVLAQILTLQSPDPGVLLLDALGVDTAEARRRLDAGASDN